MNKIEDVPYPRLAPDHAANSNVVSGREKEGEQTDEAMEGRVQ